MVVASYASARALPSGFTLMPSTVPTSLPPR